MRLTLLTFLVAFQIGPVSTGAAQENQKLPEHEMAIQNFLFQGMRFGTSGTEFLRRIPGAEFDQNQSDQQKKLHVLLIEDVPGTDYVEASFIDEKLYEISFYYFPETLNKQGGWKAVSEKVASEFGAADVSEVGRDSAVIASLSWNFLAVERFIGITVLERSVKVTFSDTSGYSKMTDRIGRKGAERHQIEEENAVEIEQRRIEADGRRISLAESEAIEKQIDEALAKMMSSKTKSKGDSEAVMQFRLRGEEEKAKRQEIEAKSLLRQAIDAEISAIRSEIRALSASIHGAEVTTYEQRKRVQLVRNQIYAKDRVIQAKNAQKSAIKN